jgi:phosphoglycerate dehydrogenase-like enzyme
LWQFPNVIATPHIAGSDKSRQFQGALCELFLQNLSRYLANRSLLNEISAQEWREALVSRSWND